VTNEQYQEFAKASKYEPADDGNYLKHWVPAESSSTSQHPPPRQPAAGTETQPVRWVSLDDARAYCAWRGARLPTEFEWQLAGQGADVQAGRPARRFPWGDSLPDHNGTRIPKPTSATPYVPQPIGMHPAGATPSGVHDLAGNVWQWTSEMVDERTRAAILRGGSAYQPGSSDQFGDNWYFPGGAPYRTAPDGSEDFIYFGQGTPWGTDKYPAAYSLTSHAKLLLMAPSYDRSGAIGFRCAANASSANISAARAT